MPFSNMLIQYLILPAFACPDAPRPPDETLLTLDPELHNGFTPFTSIKAVKYINRETAISMIYLLDADTTHSTFQITRHTVHPGSTENCPFLPTFAPISIPSGI